MNEVTIVRPLTGPEIIEAICYKLRENLEKNCLLSPHQAYPGVAFEAKVDIHFTNPASYVKEAVGFASGKEGEIDPSQPTVQETVTVKQGDTSPNELRRDTDQGVPALVKTPQGKVEEKRLRYQRKEPRV